MSPRHLRVRVGLELADVASALDMSVPSLRLLEATPTGAWTAQILARYLAATGHVLRLVATDADGRETEVE